MEKKNNQDFGVTKGDVSFLCGMVQLPSSEVWGCADRVERLFRGPKEIKRGTEKWFHANKNGDRCK